MRHAHADFLDAALRAFVQDRIQSYHERFRALEREAFLSDIAFVQENLERFRFHQCSKKSDLHSSWRSMFVRLQFQAPANPISAVSILAVHKSGFYCIAE